MQLAAGLIIGCTANAVGVVDFIKTLQVVFAVFII